MLIDELIDDLPKQLQALFDHKKHWSCQQDDMTS